MMRQANMTTISFVDSHLFQKNVGTKIKSLYWFLEVSLTSNTN